MKNIKSTLFYAIYGMSLVSLGAIIIISLLWPRDNLFSWQMILGVFLLSVLFLLCFFVWEKLRCKFNNITSFSIALTILYGIMLYFVNCFNRNEPNSLVDYGIVWNNAWELARGNEIVSREYFLTYSNNIKPMLLLGFMFRIAFLLGMEDPFYFVLIFSVLEVIAAIWSVMMLAQDNDKFGVPIIVCFGMCLPIWANTQAFYTDAMSFPFAIVIIALTKGAYKAEKRATRKVCSVVAGGLLALGIAIKVTVCIPIIATGIAIFFVCDRSTAKRIVANLVTGGVSFICTFFFLECWVGAYEITRLAKETSDPIIAWMALGLKGEGNFYSGQEFIYGLHTLPTKAEKVTISKEYILENKFYFWDAEHIRLKIRLNYASGHLGNTDFTYYSIGETNILWELFAPYGRYYWRTSQISFCYMHALFLVCFIGNVFSIIQYKREKKFSYTLLIADLSFLGYFLFLLLWEANNRQLYNMLPMLILGTVLHANQIVVEVSERIKKLR